MPPSQEGMLAEPILLELRDWLVALQTEIQRRVADAVRRHAGVALASVAREEASDTIYELDRGVDELLLERCASLGQRYPFVLIAEGNTRTFPAATDRETAAFVLIVDPVDGTRGIMYDKRSAWALAAVAPNRGSDTSLADIVLAVQTEVPTSKQYLADTLWAIRGKGARAVRRNLLTGEEVPFALLPSQAQDLSHGFAMLTKFFPGGKVVTAEIEEQLYARLGSLVSADRARVFDDQYISTGGQLYELAVGHDRFNGDIRAALKALPAARGYPPGLTAHPYDICTELIAREAGVIVTDLQGGPLRAPLSEDAEVSWLAYANKSLQAQIEPILQDLFREHGLL